MNLLLVINGGDMFCMACVFDKKASSLRPVKINNVNFLSDNMSFPLAGNDEAFSYFVKGERFDLVLLYPSKRLLAEVVSINESGYVNVTFI
ncbi:hypothetical protein [Morganella morganii]|uniref:hypothetical protein n=1 Tax=Morganella morganii TaxID=582 RepID=UPI001BDA4B72|nr:hypothetical protein [Morganella morganii]MBT0422954.1 hypothetical protein [Morganella morganii subsp. morganii]MBT0517552.1 hypothetical protein [Morganella morganii subsp. morganii]QWM05649.1 hypothetical protein IZ185_08100 [Morganella morganii subsp. morganii]